MFPKGTKAYMLSPKETAKEETLLLVSGANGQPKYNDLWSGLPNNANPDHPRSTTRRERTQRPAAGSSLQESDTSLKFLLARTADNENVYGYWLTEKSVAISEAVSSTKRRQARTHLRAAD